MLDRPPHGRNASPSSATPGAKNRGCARRRNALRASARAALRSTAGALAIAAAGSAATAHAGPYDLDLSSFGTVTSDGKVQRDDAAFRTLSSELGTLMAPKPVDPADSLGLSGFAIAGDVSVNTISHKSTAWREATGGRAHGVVPTLQVFGRKGLWPGVEVGGGATHLFQSRMWALGGYAKVALHEGFHHLPIPTIALRGSFSKLLGVPQLNLFTAAPAVEISHVFGLGRTVNLTPYAGYEALFIVSSSTVIDATPSCDEFNDRYNETCDGVPPGATSEFAFNRQSAIVRHRPFVGARFMFSVFRIALEAMIVPKGGTSDTIDAKKVTDGSSLQQQYTLSLGLDF